MKRALVAVGLGSESAATVVPEPRHQRLVMALGLTFSLILAGTATPAMAVVLRDVPPYSAAALRNLLVALVYVILLVATRTPLVISRGDVAKLVLAGLLGFAGSHGLQAVGLTMTTVIPASLLWGLSPVIVALLAALLLRERIGWCLVTAIAVSFAGTLILSGVTPAALAQLGTRAGAVGNLLILLGTVFAAITIVLTKDLLANNRPVVIMAGSFVVGGLALLPLSVMELSTGVDARLTVQSAAIFVYLALVVGVLSYLVWMWVLQWTPASTVGVFTYVSPLVGVLIGVVILGEVLTLSALIGGAAIVAGLILASRAGPAAG
jgi:drug/metabolite transporter (DMT)-like permease